MTLLSTPTEDGTPSSLGRGHWSAFKSGFTPSLDADSSALGDDSLPTATASTFTFSAEVPPPSCSEEETNEDEDNNGRAEDGEEKLTWWQIAGRSMDTVFANIAWFSDHSEMYLLEVARLNAPPQYPKRSYNALFSTDANFRVSNRLSRSTESTDPCFNDGRAYLVPMKEYSAYVDSVEAGKDEEVSAQAALGKGLRTTGVAGMFCARHELWQPLGLAPLKKGEQYRAIDFISTMAHRFVRAPVVVHPYDIVYQWHKNLLNRLAAVKKAEHESVFEGARAMISRALVFVVPKFHIFAHVLDCFLRFHPSYTRGVAQADGEACKRVWASVNPAATSIREMGPGLCGTRWTAYAVRTAIKRSAVLARIHAAIFAAAEERTLERVATMLQAVEHFEEDMNPKAGRPCPYKDEGDDLMSEYIAALAEKTDTVADQPSSTVDAEDGVGETAANARCANSGCADPTCTSAEGDDADGLADSGKSKAGVADEPAECEAGSAEGMARAVLTFKEDQQRLMPATFTTMTGRDALPDDDEACSAKLCLPSELSPQLRAEYSTLVSM
ncbi:unnamed protein product [Peniophora sp. CBMAI 1063]|nr:unnamed protein product [Peniophora sp. CBMAI 1063]